MDQTQSNTQTILLTTIKTEKSDEPIISEVKKKGVSTKIMQIKRCSKRKAKN